MRMQIDPPRGGASPAPAAGIGQCSARFAAEYPTSRDSNASSSNSESSRSATAGSVSKRAAAADKFASLFAGTLEVVVCVKKHLARHPLPKFDLIEARL